MIRLYDIIRKVNEDHDRVNLSVGFGSLQGVSFNPVSPNWQKLKQKDMVFKIDMQPVAHWPNVAESIVQGPAGWLGIEDWLPEKVHPQDNFLDVDRHLDPYRLAGPQRKFTSWTDDKDLLMQSFLENFNNGGAGDTLVLPDKCRIELEAKSKSYSGPLGPLRHVCFEPYEGDPFLLQSDTWTIYRRWDPYRKTWDRGNLACEAPGYNLRIRGVVFT